MTEENRKKKEYLDKYQQLSKRIDSLLEEKRIVYSRATRITPSYSDMPRGGQDDRIQSAVDRLCEIDKQIDIEVDKLVDMRKEIMRTIKTVGQPLLEAILINRYINGMKWEQIAVKMNYEYRWILHLHGKALGRIKTQH